MFYLCHFLLSENTPDDWKRDILCFYPPLKAKLKGKLPKAKDRQIIANFFSDAHDFLSPTLKKKARVYQRAWDPINTEIMKALSSIVEIAWPSGLKTISAHVSLNPICPRFIKEKAFHVFRGRSIEEMKECAIHELLHFIYFEKWKRVFPETPEREFDAPFLVWHLSEMVPGVVLNDPRIQNVFKYKFRSYPEYEAIKTNGVPMLTRLKQLYDNSKNFEEFLREAWEFAYEHKKLVCSS